MRISVKVVPKASRESVERYGNGLKVCVKVAAEKGRANDAVEKLIAKNFSVPRAKIRIVSGHISPHKTVEIDDFSMESLDRIFGDK